jgi:hypothetical protein
LYLARLSWRTWRVGSLAGYGRYSVTSRAQRSAFGTPAAASAAAISDWDAVLAETFPTAVALDGSGAVDEAGATDPAGVEVAVVDDVAADPLVQAPTTSSAATAVSPRRERARLRGVDMKEILSTAVDFAMGELRRDHRRR